MNRLLLSLYMFLDIITNNCELFVHKINGEIRYDLIFKKFGKGYRMRIAYEDE